MHYFLKNFSNYWILKWGKSNSAGVISGCLCFWSRVTKRDVTDDHFYVTWRISIAILRNLRMNCEWSVNDHENKQTPATMARVSLLHQLQHSDWIQLWWYQHYNKIVIKFLKSSRLYFKWWFGSKDMVVCPCWQNRQGCHAHTSLWCRAVAPKWTQSTNKSCITIIRHVVILMVMCFLNVCCSERD